MNLLSYDVIISSSQKISRCIFHWEQFHVIPVEMWCFCSEADWFYYEGFTMKFTVKTMPYLCVCSCFTYQYENWCKWNLKLRYRGTDFLWIASGRSCWLILWMSFLYIHNYSTWRGEWELIKLYMIISFMSCDLHDTVGNRSVQSKHHSIEHHIFYLLCLEL